MGRNRSRAPQGELEIQTERSWQRSPAAKPPRCTRSFGQADVDAVSAPLALPLRGGGANGGHADRPHHGAAIGANVGGSTSTFASRFAHRPLPTPEVAAALFPMGTVCTASLICRRHSRGIFGASVLIW